MKPLNTIPIEIFLDKARIAARSNQKSLSMDIKEVVSLSDAIVSMMTKLLGKPTAAAPSKLDNITVNADGGRF